MIDESLIGTNKKHEYGFILINLSLIKYHAWKRLQLTTNEKVLICEYWGKVLLAVL